MRQKRGQLTIVVIIAIVIVISVVLIYFLVNQPGQDKENTQGTKIYLSTSDQIEACFDSVVTEALTELSTQGGYYAEPATEYIDTGNTFVPVYYVGGKTYVPSRPFMQDELSNSVFFKGLTCLQDYSTDEVKYNYNDVEVKINEQEVTFKLDLLLTLNESGNIQLINYNDRPIVIPSKLYDMNEFSDVIIRFHEINEGNICLSCFTEIAEESGLYVDMSTEFEGLILVNIIDDQEINTPSLYRFFMLIDEEDREFDFSTGIATTEGNDEINLTVPFLDES